MDSSFWLQRWETNNIGFHRSEVNPALANHVSQLSLSKNSRIFLPLCGKTRDIAWLLSQGYRIAGAELIEMAIEQLFDELSIEPKISSIGEIRQYSAADIDIFVGNIFDISKGILGSVDAIYDRAALVALPKDVRYRYTTHLAQITDRVPQLLVTFEYDQSLMDGPPFSISTEEVKQHYSDSYDLSLLANTDVEGGLKGLRAAKQNVWLLERPQ
ncbi:MAG: thiopurine S-methyltransferase [Cyanobacteria bacterium P01_F01_bin.33]